jgi:competence protein ComEA
MRAFIFLVTLAVCSVAISAQAWGGKRPTQKELNGVVNLNNATPQQLDVLPGVGAKAIKLILDYRQKKPFATVAELTRVRGFGAKKMAKLKPYLAVSGETTISVKRVALKTDEPSALSPAPKPTVN